MINNSIKSRQIAKNTLLLYFRMLLMMGVSLYTSRVILDALGIEDFGIYNVVGGVVAMFSILSGSLSAAISRFITFELGKENMAQLKIIFSSAVTIQVLLALIIVLLAETVGVWFLNARMNIPEVRLYAANWVLQISIATFFVNLISIPYNASIIAHEKMSIFAYISIIEAFAKLSIAYWVVYSPIDPLIFYALLICMVALIIRFIYGFYCKRNFEECHYQLVLNKDILKQMFGFAGWNFIGASSAVLRDQGGNILLNLFFGPTVNASRGISLQVNGAIGSFVSNFMTALNPQITKSYASGQNDYMMMLIRQGARFSFYLLLLLSLPILLNTHYILTLWLKQVPEYAVSFVQLILIFTLCESISHPLITAMLATGNIRNYQIIVGGLQMLNLPLSYLFLKLDYTPEVTLMVAIFISFCCLGARLIMLRRMINLHVSSFFRDVILNVFFVSCLSYFLLRIVASFLENDFFSFIVLSLISLLFTSLIIYYIGCTSQERSFIFDKFQNIKHKMR